MRHLTCVSLWALSIILCGCASENASENSATSESTETLEGSAIPGGYSTIASDNSEVTAAAEFAVAEESKKGTKLELKSITSAESQVVAGTNYKLNIVVDEGGTEKAVEVVVYQDLQQVLSVTSWTTK
jgi:hypothetical protein